MKRREFLMMGAAAAVAGCATSETPQARNYMGQGGAAAGAAGDPRIRGPFPILSTPFNEDGSVDWESLARGCVFTADGGCPGVIWCQSNDAVDLLTFEEKAKGYDVCA